MRSHLVLAVLMSTAAVPALAADLPARSTPVPPVFTQAPYSWTGFHIGANLGYGVHRSDARDGLAMTSFLGAQPIVLGGAGVGLDTLLKPNGRGVLGGLQAGYDRQIGAMVLGLEGDLSLANMHGASGASAYAEDGVVTINPGIPGPLPYYNGRITRVSIENARSTELKSFGTLRARLGVASDRGLVYATGGLAFGKVRNTMSSHVAATTDTYSGSLIFSDTAGADYFGVSDKWRMGWTAGGGVAYAVDRNWSIKLESLYYRLQDAKVAGAAVGYTISNGVPGALTKAHVVAKAKNDGVIARVGLDYKFGGPAAGK